MTRGILLRTHGGPEVFEWSTLELPRLKRSEVRVRHTAVGVNYIDVYDRTGLYPMKLPGSVGREAAGVVEQVGSKVKSYKPGDRVAYVLSSPGSYAEARNVPAERLVRLPPGISDEQAAGMMLKGLTAHYLLRRTYRVKRGETILVHAAAGGVGTLLCQWARALGCRVIGVVGSEEKVDLARRNGCRQVLVSGRDEIVSAVRALTRKEGVAVVYDSVGKDTFMESLDCLRPLGMMVTYGNASGPPPPISPLELSKRGSLFLTRPSLYSYIAHRKELEAAARELFAAVRSRKVRVLVGQRYALADAAEAHRDLEARRTTGATVLVP